MDINDFPKVRDSIKRFTTKELISIMKRPDLQSASREDVECAFIEFAEEDYLRRKAALVVQATLDSQLLVIEPESGTVRFADDNVRVAFLSKFIGQSSKI
ncbi:MAG TPA: hypothetical protein VE973_01650 [Candidatus Limnocylindria bacterium]|nr:hypothetical protein [Candidatus Limnocylindria bacterium]